MNSSHRPHGKIADALASTLACQAEITRMVTGMIATSRWTAPLNKASASAAHHAAHCPPTTSAFASLSATQAVACAAALAPYRWTAPPNKAPASAAHLAAHCPPITSAFASLSAPQATQAVACAAAPPFVRRRIPEQPTPTLPRFPWPARCKLPNFNWALVWQYCGMWGYALSLGLKVSSAMYPSQLVT